MADAKVTMKLVLDDGTEASAEMDIDGLFEELAKLGEPIVAPAGIFFPMIDVVTTSENGLIN